jgi:hypothetical protein
MHLNRHGIDSLALLKKVLNSGKAANQGLSRDANAVDPQGTRTRPVKQALHKKILVMGGCRADDGSVRRVHPTTP